MGADDEPDDEPESAQSYRLRGAVDDGHVHLEDCGRVLRMMDLRAHTGEREQRDES